VDNIICVFKSLGRDKYLSDVLIFMIQHRLLVDELEKLYNNWLCSAKVTYEGLVEANAIFRVDKRTLFWKDSYQVSGLITVDEPIDLEVRDLEIVLQTTAKDGVIYDLRTVRGPVVTLFPFYEHKKLVQ